MTCNGLCRQAAALLGAATIVGASALAEPDTGAAGSCDRAHFRLVIDVGHTAITYGATSANGLPEFQFNLSLAQVVLQHLRDAGFFQADAIVEQGRENLAERARRLNAARPDLILSLHHDAVQDRYLKSWVVDGKTQDYSDDFSGYSIFVSEENPRFADSKKFAILLGAELRGRDYKFTMHHTEKIPGENRPVLDAGVGVFRYDNLVVLHEAKAPAVLLEAAVIVNRDDERRARDPDYQAGIAESVVAALDKYCAAIKPGAHRG